MKNYITPTLRITLFAKDEEIIASAIPPANDIPENEFEDNDNIGTVPDFDFDANN